MEWIIFEIWPTKEFGKESRLADNWQMFLYRDVWADVCMGSLQKCQITAAVRENNLSNWSDFTTAVNQFKWSCTQFIRTAEFVGQVLFQHVIENFAELQMKKHRVELIS